MVLEWCGDPPPSSQSVPLRLAAALHALVLTGAPDLAAVYPPRSDSATDDEFWGVCLHCFEVERKFVLDWLQSPPQTNEVRRSNAIYPGLALIAAETKVEKLSLLELGASAGLNLVCDRFQYDFGDGLLRGETGSALSLKPEWRGNPPPDAAISIVARAGCDQNPMNIRDDRDLLRLRAYTWPDQTDRLERLDAAAKIARDVLASDALNKCDVGQWLEERLASPLADTVSVIFHSIAWQYFSSETVTRCQSAIERAASRATASSPLAWLAMEDDDGPEGAAIRLQIWPQGIDRIIGRADFHGRWISWMG